MKNKLFTKVIPIEIELAGMHCSAEAVAIDGLFDEMPKTFSVGQNKKIYFHIRHDATGWQAIERQIVPQSVVEKIGDFIYKYCV
jgi:hypothetical protein